MSLSLYDVLEGSALKVLSCTVFFFTFITTPISNCFLHFYLVSYYVKCVSNYIWDLFYISLVSVVAVTFLVLYMLYGLDFVSISLSVLFVISKVKLSEKRILFWILQHIQGKQTITSSFLLVTKLLLLLLLFGFYLFACLLFFLLGMSIQRWSKLDIWLSDVRRGFVQGL